MGPVVLHSWGYGRIFMALWPYIHGYRFTTMAVYNKTKSLEVLKDIVVGTWPYSLWPMASIAYGLWPLGWPVAYGLYSHGLWPLGWPVACFI